MNLDDESFARRAVEIEWLLLDVDGVLTDGRLYFGRLGQTLQAFDIKDGLGMKLAQQAGIKVGVLSARRSAAAERRAAELRLDAVLTGRNDKGAAFEHFLAAQHTTAHRVAYVGDDLPDLAVLARCGLSFAPADAAAEVRAVAHRQLARAGGRGAVREAIEAILRARGDWERVTAPFGGRG